MCTKSNKAKAIATTRSQGKATQTVLRYLGVQGNDQIQKKKGVCWEKINVRRS